MSLAHSNLDDEFDKEDSSMPTCIGNHDPTYRTPSDVLPISSSSAITEQIDTLYHAIAYPCTLSVRCLGIFSHSTNLNVHPALHLLLNHAIHQKHQNLIAALWKTSAANVYNPQKVRLSAIPDPITAVGSCEHGSCTEPKRNQLWKQCSCLKDQQPQNRLPDLSL